MIEVTTHLKRKNGSLATGLNPLVYIIRVSDNALVVDAQPMTELRLGFYEYEFDGYNPAQRYLILVDSVSLTGRARYGQGSIAPFERGLEEVIENGIKGKHMLSCALAYMANVRAGGGTNQLTYQNNANDAARIVQTVNERGEVLESDIDVSDIP